MKCKRKFDYPVFINIFKSNMLYCSVCLCVCDFVMCVCVGVHCVLICLVLYCDVCMFCVTASGNRCGVRFMIVCGFFMCDAS